MTALRDYAGELDAGRAWLVGSLHRCGKDATAALVEAMSDAELRDLLPTLHAIVPAEAGAPC